VLEGSVAVPSRAVQVCFTPRNVAPEESPRRFLGSSAAYDVRPVNGALWNERGEPMDVPRCSELSGLVTYSVHWTENLDMPDYNFHGIEARVVTGYSTDSGAPRTMIEVGELFNATNPRDSVKIREGDLVTEKSWNDFGGSGSLTLKGSYVQGPHYRGIGLFGDAMYSVDWLPRGCAAGVTWGFRHYRGEQRKSNVFDWAVKFVAGVEVVNLVLVIDRGLGADENGVLHNETFVMGGVEMAISMDWFDWRKRKRPAPDETACTITPPPAPR
jgi:hypothetical protein